jgi:hypothetical protein
LVEATGSGSTRGLLCFFEDLILDLEEYAEHNFKLSIPDKDGVTERQHLEEVERQSGRTPLALQGTEFPELLEYVWTAFLLLNQGRGQGFNGPLPLSFQEILAWQQLTDTYLLPWEVSTIKRLDAVYLRVVAKNV